MSLFDLARFIWDRVNMGRKATVAITSFREAKPVVLKHLAAVEDLLNRDFPLEPHPDA